MGHIGNVPHDRQPTVLSFAVLTVEKLDLDSVDLPEKIFDQPLVTRYAEVAGLSVFDPERGRIQFHQHGLAGRRNARSRGL